MRKPNGYGSVVKLSGNRRKPFAVRITKGWTDTGNQKIKYLSYFDNRKDAEIFLAKFNENPNIIDTTIILSDLYDKWSRKKFEEAADSTVLGYTAAYKYMEPLHKRKWNSLTVADMQSVVDECPKGRATKAKIRVLFSMLHDFAFAQGMTSTQNYAKYIKLPKKQKKKSSKNITVDKIKKLWDIHQNYQDMDIVLILIYSGWRINELLNMETANVNLEEGWFKGGNKTEASKDRIVPIHDDIFEFVRKRYDPTKKYLINNRLGKHMKYSNFKRERWERFMADLGWDHTIHDTRHTFASLLNNNFADENSIRLLMGHAGKDITEQVYIHADIEYLRANIQKIKL